MKKIYLLFVIIILGTNLTAQTKGNVNGWYSPIDFIKNNATGPFTDTVEIVFPDSSVVFMDKNNQAKKIYTHAWGHLYDLRYDNWAAVPSDPNYPIQVWAQKCDYVWDSLAFNYVYRRNNADTNVVDTCFVTYYKNTDLDQIRNGLAIFTNGDTMLYARPRGIDAIALAGEYFFKRDTFLLTAVDTTKLLSNGWSSKYIVLPVGTSISGTSDLKISKNPRSWFAATITYKPGHNWNIGDTIETRSLPQSKNGINYFGFTYTMIKEANGGLPITLKSRYFADNSLLLTSNPRLPNYNGFAPANTFSSPMFANVNTFISGTNCIGSVKEFGLSLGKVYPNPATNNQTLFIDYKLKKTTVISLDVYNIMGKKVATVLDNERVEAGEHKAAATFNLEPGIYFYNLSSGNTAISSQKFTVIR